MKFTSLAAIAAALSVAPIAANAQEAAAPVAVASAQISEGAAVIGNDGNPIGTVAAVNEQAVLVDTGTHQIPLPAEAFAAADAGLTLNITQGELNDAYGQQVAAAAAALDAALVAGTEVMTADAQALGTVDEVNDDSVVLALENDARITLGKEIFALDAQGSVMILATMAQIQEAIATQAG